MKRIGLVLFALALITCGLMAQDAKTPEKAPPAPAAAAQGGEVALEWSFKKGATWWQKLRSTQDQKMKINNTNVEQKQEQEFIFAWTVIDADQTKIVLKQEIKAIIMKIALSGSEIKYDSTQPNAADNPLSSFFRPLLGSQFTIYLDPKTMKVTKIDGRDEFVKKLQETNPQMKLLLNAILGENEMKQMTEPTFMVVPDAGKKVKSKDKWNRAVVLKLGPIGSFDAKYDYTYDGMDKRTFDGKESNYHKITAASTMEYKAPDAKEATGLPFTITSGDIKSNESTGTIYFDMERGRVVNSEMVVKLKGKLDIKVSEQSAPVELDQVTRTYTDVFEKNPLGEAAAPATTTPPATTPAAAPGKN